MISCVIFDMDGVLIDSEPLWRKAEMQVFAKNGLKLTEADCMQTTGLRIDKVVEFWQHKHPKLNLDVLNISRQIETEVGALIKKEGKAMRGVYAILDRFKELKLPMALASSSSSYLINIVLDALKLRSYFVHALSAENLQEGKPNPEIFTLTAKKMQVNCKNCLVFEDSKFGVEAALAADMFVVAIPDAHSWTNDYTNKAHARFENLEQLDEETINTLLHL